MRSLRRPFAALALPLIVMLTACAEDGPLPVVGAITVSMDDFSIDVPEAVEAGLVEVHGINSGDVTHQVGFARLPDGMTAEEHIEHLKADLGAAVDAADYRGGVQLVRPGHEQTVTIDLDPGEYVVVCVLPGPEPGESHLLHGMWAELTVVSGGPDRDSDSIDRLPTDGTIELIDWAFDVPDTLQSGDVYTVVNNGTQVHEIGMAALADGATRDDVLAFLTGEAPADAPPPFTDLSGVGWLSPGESQTLPIDVPPGRYVFVCYIPDPDDGTPHFMKGMISVVTVT